MPIQTPPDLRRPGDLPLPPAPAPLPDPVLMADGYVTVADLRDGTREKVLVALVPVEDLLEYQSEIVFPARVVARTTGRAAPWVRTLQDDSLYYLYRLALSLNDPRVRRLRQEIEQAVHTLRGLAASPESSASPSTSPSPASASGDPAPSSAG